MDILSLTYNVLIADDYIRDQAGNDDRIKYFKYPETGNVDNPYIVITPIDAPTPKDFADNTWLTFDCLIQIDVWSPQRTLTNGIADRIRDALWERLGLQMTPGPQEYDKNIYSDARRYRGTLYREDFDSI